MLYGKRYGKLSVDATVNAIVIHRVNDMVKGHKPPAQIRYEQSHPTVSCRLDKDTHTLLKQRLEDLGGVSFADFVKDALGLLELKMRNIEEIKERAWDEGYNQGADECEIWYYCAVCRKRIDMKPNSDSHKAMIGYMKEHGWGHASCHGE